MKASVLREALLELLGAAPGTSSQLLQRLETAGAKVHPEIVASALQQLKRTGQVIRAADGTYGRVTDSTKPPPKPIEPTEIEMANKTCPRCEKSKSDAEFCANGYCKPCNRAKAQEYYQRRKSKGAKPAKAAKVVKPNGTAHRTTSGFLVRQQVTIEMRDAGGKSHALSLSHDQAAELHAALGALL